MHCFQNRVLVRLVSSVSRLVSSCLACSFLLKNGSNGIFLYSLNERQSLCVVAPRCLPCTFPTTIYLLVILMCFYNVTNFFPIPCPVCVYDYSFIHISIFSVLVDKRSYIIISHLLEPSISLKVYISMFAPSLRGTEAVPVDPLYSHRPLCLALCCVLP